ncbi:ADP-ribose pyrophosphatase YjhB (NUDIX family) [Variovorax beijingensis]|jgi:ADP-ribose pyrophosphatase YjhB (NUDIX family)|uniref:ADP-ribose pyrophosphatase YjhB (NUDIX family) n=2 Tax=Variovorax TaxID=34072 RepID=A0AAE3Y2M2_VARPD|nr:MULTISPECIES: NUDIX hydrolase [Variovorax]MBD9664252.1 NUDIX hydrolase [Variovorax sp. VRV01]MDP9965195.1 ADP-ribose pyrophosphatase YjhB (NUDIX family) [Variovorax paradoxus]MDR6428370.1 ADP-ribose pyrophosphatase YjhB (NUDIX family) [Variovorax paradoxus]MDR6455023.1 ADP-ribose pyrophosphatase YjhB (NUDIX family) [Variovorax paradoxus]TWD85019.1 ADP-ribose pyrophosphatase YjhB (NUDIX family) [Variovorax beijingensis]
MISVHLHGQRFQVRAAAVILHAGHALLHRAPGDDYWALPGGRVEVGEEASATIVREMREELGEEVECGRLLHVAENFFDLAGRRNHEIGFYFLVSLAEDSPHLDKARSYRGIESHLDLEFRWFPISELAAVNLRPTFLPASLAADPLAFSHAVQREYP